MKKTFSFQKIVTFNHSIEVEIPEDMEDEYEEFADKVADNIYYSDNENDLCSEFSEKFGEDNVTFIEDGSPEVEIECL